MARYRNRYVYREGVHGYWIKQENIAGTRRRKTRWATCTAAAIIADGPGWSALSRFFSQDSPPTHCTGCTVHRFSSTEHPARYSGGNMSQTRTKCAHGNWQNRVRSSGPRVIVGRCSWKRQSAKSNFARDLGKKTSPDRGRAWQKCNKNRRREWKVIVKRKERAI